MTAKIIYTKIDEAPALATYSLLPILKAFTKENGVDFEEWDISLAGRIIANFSDMLDESHRLEDYLEKMGKLAKTPEANIVKLPNISASLPQLKEAIGELQERGYTIPDYPDSPKDDKEREIHQRYAKVLGSAVNPVLREGNSDRRAAASVKKHGQTNPHRMMKEWPADSRTRVAYMADNNFFSTEKSVTVDEQTEVRIEFVGEDGVAQTLKESTPLLAGEIIDAAVMDVDALQKFFEQQIAEAKEKNVLLSLHLKATMMKVSDPIMFGHCVSVYYRDVFTKHGKLLADLGVNVNNGIGDVYCQLEKAPEKTRQQVRSDIDKVYNDRPPLAMVDSTKGITNLHVPNNVIIDASMPVVIRDGGRMWGPDDALHDTIAMIPDASYATIYQAVVENCQQYGAFDPATMGSVANVGLMAQKAEEYGSHDKTFEAPGIGLIRVVDRNDNVLLQQRVGKGDIFRMCQTKDAPVKDWVKLAVNRARISAEPAIFWLDRERAHDREILAKLELYLQDHDTGGLDIQILPPTEAMQLTLERVRKGENTIAVTGNVLRDYLTDLFPILELGTSAKMLSIVPLMNGGGLFETGAGGSAPKHVQQFLQEGHLRWDSLGEFCALVASFEHLGRAFNHQQAAILAETLDEAIGKHLAEGRAPSRRVNELDNRGSHFYLALYWAEALAGQDKDANLKERFATVAKRLSENEEQIIGEMNEVQGQPVDIGGYYLPDDEMAAHAMRPSKTFNSIIADI